jgi:hypothetical protein
MATYLMRFSYTPETWSKLLQTPEDRRDAAQPLTTSQWPASRLLSRRVALWARSRLRCC